MKKIVSFLLVLLLSVTANSGALLSLSKIEFSRKETSVAQSADDNYQAYNSANSNVSAPKQTSAAYAFTEYTFEPVMQTITVMTTATGSEERGNYVASKPIANAVVRIDGVPRYTDRNGQITTKIDREIVELYVEKTTDIEKYNPYIEVMEVTGKEKTIYLKQPSDDIEIFYAMLEYGNNFFNVLSQQAHVLKGYDDDYSEITIEANVVADAFLFYVNGELEKVSADGIIEMIDFEEYSNGDIFEIQIFYNGVYSKILPLQIIIDIFDTEELQREIEMEFKKTDSQTVRTMSSNGNDDEEFSFGNDESGIGEAGAINLPVEIVIAALTQLIIPKNTSIQVGKAKINVEFYVNPFSGIIRFAVGISCEIDIADKIADKKQHKNETKAAYKERRAAEMKEVEKEALEAQKEIQKFNKEISESNDNHEEKQKKLREAENRYYDAAEKYVKYSKNCYLEKSNYKTAEREYNKAEEKYTGAYNSLCNTVKNSKLDKASTGSLIEYLQKGKGYKQKAAILQDFFSGGAKNATGKGSFGFDLQFSLIGFVEYSYRTRKIENSGLTGEVILKPSYTYQGFAPVGPVVIPFYIKIEANLGAEVQLISHSDDKPFNIKMGFIEWVKNIRVMFNVGVRIDGGVGLAGIASVGVYGKVNFKYTLFPKTDRGWEFSWGAGVKVQFLMLEAEWGYDSVPKPMKADAQLTSYNIMARSMANILNLSDAQLFDSVYQLSQPIILPLENNKQILLWVADDATRDNFNRSVLQYSIFDGNNWSNPQRVFNDSFSDYSFDATLNNGNVTIAAQRTAASIDESMSIGSVLSSSEIYVAELKTGATSFTNIERITTNNKLDANPQFITSNNALKLSWRSNTENDYFGIAGENEIYYCDNIFDENTITKLYSTTDIIGNYSVTYKNGDMYLAVQVDSDGDFLTEGSDLIVLKNNENFSIISNASNPNFVVKDNSTSLIYYTESSIVESEDYITVSSTIIKENASPIFTMSKTQTNTSLFYTQQDDLGEQVYCALFDGINWINNIKISNENSEGNDIGQLSGYYDGSHIISAYNLSDNESNIVVCFAQKSRKYDFNFSAEIYEKTDDNSQNSLIISLDNIGDYEIAGIEITFDGLSIQYDINEKIIVGENRYLSINLPNSINIYGEHLIEIDILDVSGLIVSSKSQKIYLSENDISVSFEQIILNQKQHFIIDINNSGVLDCAGFVYVYINGILHNTLEFNLLANEQEHLDITLNKIFNGDEIHFVIEPDIEDRSKYDNIISCDSLQDEIEANILHNPYKNLIDNAKEFIGR